MNTAIKQTVNRSFAISRKSMLVGFTFCLCYLGLVLNGQLFGLLFPSPMEDGPVIARELINLAMVGWIVWVVVRVERKPLTSIGLHRRHWGRSVAWGVLLAVICLAAAVALMGLLQLAGVRYGSDNAFSQLSLWTVTLITIRAGVAEEIMMRGYLLERIQEKSGSAIAAAFLTLIPFALLHFTQGPAGILISFVLGGLLTVFYLWKRDLKANIIAHFLVDFTANVGIPLLASLAA